MATTFNYLVFLFIQIMFQQGLDSLGASIVLKIILGSLAWAWFFKLIERSNK